MALFLSTFTNKLDSKGRVSVPSSFRAVLGAQGLASFVAYPSLTSRAIEACGPERMQALADSMDSSLAFFSPEQASLGAEIFGSAAELSWDGEGRVVLPEALIAHSGIVGQASFVGLGRAFQIWEPQALAEVKNAARAQLATNPPRLLLGNAANGGRA